MPRRCDLKVCDNKHHAKGLCKFHYNEEWKLQNPSLMRTYRKRWDRNNPNYNTEYKKMRRRSHLDTRIADNLRSRLAKAIKTGQKTGSAVSDLGCSVLELQNYLETKFLEGMSWTNWGDWHIDHIIPLFAFDLSSRKQLLEACHYTNLQPLWAFDNKQKGNRIDFEQV